MKEFTKEELELIVSSLKQSIFFKEGYISNTLNKKDAKSFEYSINKTKAEINSINKIIKSLSI
jgi:hypothetical protein